MGKKENSMVIQTEDFKLELQTGFNKSFDWRRNSLGLFLEIMIEQSRDYFEKLHPDEKENGINVIMRPLQRLRIHCIGELSFS